MDCKKQVQVHPGHFLRAFPKWKKDFALSQKVAHYPSSKRSAKKRQGATPSQLDQLNPGWPSALWQMSQPACLHFQIIHSNVSWASANAKESTEFGLRKEKGNSVVHFHCCFIFTMDQKNLKIRKRILNCKECHLLWLLVQGSDDIYTHT